MALILTRGLRPGGFILLLISLVALTVHYGYDAYVVDACLEQGGSFDFERMPCSLTATFPYVPYLNRHWPKVLLALGLSLLGFLLTTFGKSRR